jgi:hypothetical protein
LIRRKLIASGCEEALLDILPQWPRSGGTRLFDYVNSHLWALLMVVQCYIFKKQISEILISPEAKDKGWTKHFFPLDQMSATVLSIIDGHLHTDPGRSESDSSKNLEPRHSAPPVMQQPTLSVQQEDVIWDESMMDVDGLTQDASIPAPLRAAAETSFQGQEEAPVGMGKHNVDR